MADDLRCDFVIFDAGGGHRSAANALRTVMLDQGFNGEIRYVNLQKLLEPLDVMKKFTGLTLEDFYNRLLRKGWTYGTPQMISLLHVALRFYHAQQVEILEQHWRLSQPDMVVSLIPHFNRSLFQSLRHYSKWIPFVTVMTDIADYPPHFWIERQDQFLICGSQKAIEQAYLYGPPQASIYSTSGMILNPKFYEACTMERRAERMRLGLDPDIATGIVMFGGFGSNSMLEIASVLDSRSLNVQLIFLCGHNEALAQALRSQAWRRPCHVVGFTKEVPYYMRLADFFMGKPGPGSISEALAMRLPVIVECNSRTLGQERYNAEWILEKQVGLVVRRWRESGLLMDGFLELSNLNRYKANAAAIVNDGVFEVSSILRSILSSATCRCAVPA